MRFPTRPASSSPEVRQCGRNHRFRPALEKLEDRLAPAIGVFNEDFSDDLNSAVAGFDSPAQDLLIVNDLPGYLNGPTGRQGYYYVQQGTPGDPGWGLHADGHVLTVLSDFLTPQVTFTVPAPGTPGGHDADEEVSGIGVSVQGSGNVHIHGAEGDLVVAIPPGDSTWHRIAAYPDTVLPSGQALGTILSLSIYPSGFVVVDNVTVAVSSANPNDPPSVRDDIVLVNRDSGESAIFNPIDNDFDADGDALQYVFHGQPAHGTVTEERDIHGNFRGFSYRADADALADPTFHEDSFSYGIRDTHFANDSGTVRLVLNHRPWGEWLIVAPHNAPTPLRGSWPRSTATATP